MKKTVNNFVSKEQLGFVPKRLIGEATREREWCVFAAARARALSSRLALGLALDFHPRDRQPWHLAEHPRGDVATHWATAARGATLTSAWSCLADAGAVLTAKWHHTERCCARARGSERAAPVGAVAARSQAMSPTLRSPLEPSQADRHPDQLRNEPSRRRRWTRPRIEK
eukprot:scaffold36285_cov119-Isochrysis_galbana.AAC.5